MRPSFPLLPALLVAAVLPVFVSNARSETKPASSTVHERSVARIYFAESTSLRALADYDLLEHVDRDERYVLALLQDDEIAALTAEDWTVVVDDARTVELNRPRSMLLGQTAGIPGFPCYRTVEETYAGAAQLAVDQPQLATWTDIGDSWEKINGMGGYDVMALVLTNSAIPGPKPRLIAISSMHAREYTPAETLTRFAESLVGGYGTDADATWLIDHHEIHLIVQVNPDGRKQAETGLSWRKNTNQSYCGATSNNRGADINRNFEFVWGCCGGSSGNTCAETYRGPSAVSEPETQIVQAYLRANFLDQRGPDITDAAPVDTTGVYIDVHSSGRDVLWPWGYGAGLAPNSGALTTLGRKLAWFNGHFPQQAEDLYPADGASDDFAYGDLGVASFTFELGTSFFQDCPTFEGSVLPGNLPALRYAAKVARAPYMLPAGPDANAVLVTPSLADAGDPLTVSATLDDTAFNNTNGTEPSQSIAAAEFFVDTPPWSAGATPVALVAADGLFDASVEEVTGTLDTTGLAGGQHILFVRGQDASGNQGPVSAFFFYITDGSEGSAAGIVRDADTLAPLAATVSVDLLGVTAVTDPATGAYSLTLPVGAWALRAAAADHLEVVQPDVAVADGAVTPADFLLQSVPSLLVVDDDDNVPDVRAYTTDILDVLGREYLVWDTANSDNEPSASYLAAFDTVIWLTGDEFGGAAGPGGAGESALASWLDTGKCVLIHSQDYYYDRGLTGFMQAHLGVGSVDSDVSQSIAVGVAAPFAGLGGYTLSYPYSNYSDTVTPGAGASPAFAGSVGDAAVARDTGFYRASYWGFGLEALPDATARHDALNAFLGWCDDLALADADSDGTVNGEDCAPQNPGVWGIPDAVADLALQAGVAGELSWSEPPFTGGTLVYDLLRSAGAPEGATCLATGMSATSASDAAAPEAGQTYFYLIRARNECGGSIGADSQGAARSGPICF